MSSNRIQQSIPGCHAYAASPFRHLGTRRPLIGVRIKALYGLETRAPIAATNRIKSVKKSKRDDRWETELWSG